MTARTHLALPTSTAHPNLRYLPAPKPHVINVSKLDKLPPLPRDRLAQLLPRRRSRVSSSSSDGAPAETPEARYLAATKELVLTRYTHQNTTRMNSECESYDENTEENIQIIKKDMEGDEKSSSGSSSPPKHLCSSIKEKLEHTKEQMQQTRKKSSNKVGVEMPADVDSSWDRAPPCPSARFRVASGASQFREVNFSVAAVGGFGALAKVEPEAEAGTSSEGEKADSASRLGQDLEATVDDKGGRRSEEKYAIVSADASREPEQRASGSGGAVARRLVQVPQSLSLARNGALEPDFLRFSSGASTSKGADPRGCQTSLGGSMTEDTELSCGSTRTLGDEERKPTKPLAPKDDRERPVLTATSLAIYTNIEQNGSRSGTCLLCTTAVCTFIVTMVLAVGILIAPKTLAVKEPTKRPLPEPEPPAPPALPASTNASSETPSVAALHVLTITRLQKARRVDDRERTSSTWTTTPPATSGHAQASVHLAPPTASATHSSSARHTGHTLKFLRPSVHSPYREAAFSPSRSSPAAAATPLAGLSTSTLFRRMMFPSLSSGATSPSSSPPENASPPSSPEHFPPSSSPADALIATSSSSSFRQTQNPVTAHTPTPPMTYAPETSSPRNTTAIASSPSPPSGYYSPTTTILPPTAAGRERRDYLSQERILLFGQSNRKKRMN
ncbi:mucin-5AC-like [Penaeus monodon]|uniref:mucin-5AC-like n=1 Tax=Penaeus monodon TaxID=6687 RepID=UPI0018A7CB1C|nr:mucin-5AC-like [Penaeus monodon]